MCENTSVFGCAQMPDSDHLLVPKIKMMESVHELRDLFKTTAISVSILMSLDIFCTKKKGIFNHI